MYEREGNDQKVYFLLLRHAQLVLHRLQEHPDAKLKSNRRALVQAQVHANESLQKLAEIKPRIAERYKRYVRSIQEGKVQQAFVRPMASKTDSYEFLDPALAGRAQPLAPAEHKDLAVKLAQKEFKRRTTKGYGAATETRPAEAVLEHRLSVGTKPNEPMRVHEGDADRIVSLENLDEISEQEDDLFRRMQELRASVSGRPQPQPRRKVRPRKSRENLRTTLPAASEQTSAYQYPLIPAGSLLSDEAHDTMPLTPPPIPKKDPSMPITITQPPLPPRPPRPPPVPAKIRDGPLLPEPERLSVPKPPPLPKKIAQPATPEGDSAVHTRETPSPALDPSTFTFKPSAYLENGTPLRTIFISPELRKKFLIIAAANTARNLETCGILCGTLISNAFFISKLVIPDQISTSDTCEMVNEAAIFEYCDKEDLMVLGWIHTHPTQTCFMSSRDLHTHSAYQAMLAESVAIVCAPSKEPDWGVFRLTDPPGLKAVLTCTQKGIFHPHEETNIYTDALRPGHVFEVPDMPFETVDLRPGKSG